MLLIATECVLIDNECSQSTDECDIKNVKLQHASNISVNKTSRNLSSSNWSKSDTVEIYSQDAWAPAGMDKRGHLPPPLWKCCKVFLCISSYSKTKRSVGELGLFMHYFHNQSSAYGGFTPTVNPSLDPTGGLSSRPLICPPLEKSCGCPCQDALVNLSDMIQDIRNCRARRSDFQASLLGELRIHDKTSKADVDPDFFEI